MNIIIILLIFSTVLFAYLHIYYHLKVSNDLEIYEVSSASQERLDEICNLRQPVLFNFDSDKFDDLKEDKLLANYGSFDIKIRDCIEPNYEAELYLPITFKDGIKILEKDDKKYISENNQDFLEETSLIKVFKSNDEYIRPRLMSSSIYDVILGATECTTPLRYDINYKNFYTVLSGKVTVKLSPPKSSRYIYPTKDYDNFEFRSPMNPWDIQDEYKNEFEKIKCMEVTLESGKMIYIPAYWWYSFRFDEKNTVLLSFKYRTYMNTLAIVPHLGLSFLQKQNIKHSIIQKKELD